VSDYAEILEFQTSNHFKLCEHQNCLDIVSSWDLSIV